MPLSFLQTKKISLKQNSNGYIELYNYSMGVHFCGIVITLLVQVSSHINNYKLKKKNYKAKLYKLLLGMYEI